MLLQISSEVIKEPPVFISLVLIAGVLIVLVYCFYDYSLAKAFSEKKRLNHIRGKCFYFFGGKVNLGDTICFLPKDFSREEVEGSDVLLMLFTLGTLTSKTIYITLPEEWCWPIDYNKGFKIGDQVTFNSANGFDLQEAIILGIRNDKAVVEYLLDGMLEKRKIALIKLTRLA
ncbi:MAG: hypothetical protein ACRBFS_21790 [Aureispira sp.]